MFKPRRKKLAVLFFKNYFKRTIARTFSSFQYDQNFSFDRERPVLLISNHFSWWDGILLFHLNEEFLHKHYYVMMLEEQLKKNKILSYAGAFSVKKGSRGILQSLHYGKELLEDKNNLLLIFPQGKIESHHKQSFHFQKGLSKVLHKEVQVLFAAVLMDYLSEPKSGIHIYLKALPTGVLYNVEDLESAFNEHFQESVKNQISMADSLAQ